MPVIVVAANEIAFHMSGEGDQCMLFVHGIGEDFNIWKPIVDHFSSSFKCFQFSWKGFGDSKMNIATGFTPDILAKELKGIIEELNIKSDLYIIANNAGALAAIKADMDDLVHCKAIIAINIADKFKMKTKYKQLYKSLMDNSKMKMVEKMNLKDAFEKKQALIETWLRETSTVDLASKAPYIEIPIDFVLGKNNDYVTVKDVEATVGRISSSRVQVINDASNWPMLENSSALIKEIEDFIGQYIPSLDKKT